MHSYRVDYEERTEDGYIHAAHMELTATSSRQALNEIVEALASAGIHVTRIDTIKLLSRQTTSGPERRNAG